MSNTSILRTCADFAAFEGFVHDQHAIAMQKGQGELPAAMTAIKIPVITRKQHSPYSGNGPIVQFGTQSPFEVEGFVHYQKFVSVAHDAKARAVDSSKPEEKAPGVITLIVGCTYFFVEEGELKTALEMGAQASVIALRPQLRRRTQRTGLWFLDVAAADVSKFLAMDRCMLMHSEGTFIYTAGSQRRLRMWTDARDVALAGVKGLQQPVKGMKPMTIEPSKEFKEIVAAMTAAAGSW